MVTNTKTKKSGGAFRTLIAILVTALLVTLFFIGGYAWKILGVNSKGVSYSAGDAKIIGTLPETRKFQKGDEVVVRAGNFEDTDGTFVGWKDKNAVVTPAGETYKNGDIFIMPDKDVVLEAVWDDGTLEGGKESTNKEKSTSKTKKTSRKTYHKKDSKDVINLREECSYDSEVLLKIDDDDIEIIYDGKSKKLYDEDDEKDYTWYYVTVPSKDVKGWIRSDMLSADDDSDSDSDDEDDEDIENDDSEIFIKSRKYDIVSLYENADSDTKAIEKITDDTTLLYYSGKSTKAPDSDGDMVTWYYVKSENGKSGWVQSYKVDEQND